MSRETSTLRERASGLLRCLLVLLFLCPAQAPAQDEEVVTIKSQLVNIDAVVKDRRGKFVTDLKAGDFAVVENGVPQKVVFFDPPLTGGEGSAAVKTDAPVAGTDGDQVVQSFYTINPLRAPWDMDYSELDFEYLPNGGWGIEGPTLYGTTWETFYPEPNWKKDNVFETLRTSHAGWHTLVTQVSGGEVRYFVDGKPLAEHGGNYYPESPMPINFNLWFIRDGAVEGADVRTYQEDIDWVFHEANSAPTTAEVEARVAALRQRSVKFRDTVAAPSPALNSPCDF